MINIQNSYRFAAGGGIIEDGLFRHYESDNTDSYSGIGSTVWTDLIELGDADLSVGTGSDMTFNSTYNSLLANAHNSAVFKLNTPMDVGVDITYSIFYRPYSTKNTTGNPGWWRTANTTFFIFQGTTGRPWVRINGGDVLKPTSGYSVPDEVFIHYTLVIKNNDYVKIYADGVEKYSATHTKTIAASVFQFLTAHSGTENVWGDFKNIMYYKRALSQEEIAQNNNALRDLYGL